MDKTNKKIAIVGASIAGCAAAIFLQRAGLNITVYESRPKGLLDDRGAGIALPKDLVKQLIELDVLDKDFHFINVDDRIFIKYNEKNDDEHELLVKPFLASAVHWGNLYINLAKRVSDKNIHYNSKVKSVSQTEDKKLLLKLENNEEHVYDFVIFADGYHSIGRKFLYPDFKTNYTGYIAWRGILFRIDDETTKRLKNNVPFYLYEKGHLLLYSIPLAQTKDPENEYSINWLIYEKIDKNHPLYKDDKHAANIPADAMKEEYIKYLHQLANKYFPKFPREIIFQTEKPFTQAIFDAHVPHYYLDNIALIGDASILVRPHVGAGSTKAIQDALSLHKYLEKYDDIDKAMKEWSKERQQEGQDLLVLCRDLGDFLVSNVPDLKTIDTNQIERSWKEIVKGHENWYQIKK